MQEIPTLAELHLDHESAFKNDRLNLLCGQPPHNSWVKTNPMTNGKYLPIDKVEFLLRRIFGRLKYEVISYNALFQSVAVHVRVHYINPTNGEWDFQDGLGACPVQVDKGSAASDLGAIKFSAIQMALPAAESYAIKDAAEKLGALFGANLTRKDTTSFSGFFDAAKKNENKLDTSKL